MPQETRRSFFLVGSSAKRPYLSIPGFCTCAGYCHKVAAQAEVLVCKHELAVLLSEALGVSQIEEVPEEKWAKRFAIEWDLSMFECAQPTFANTSLRA